MWCLVSHIIQRPICSPPKLNCKRVAISFVKFVDQSLLVWVEAAKLLQSRPILKLFEHWVVQVDIFIRFSYPFLVKQFVFDACVEECCDKPLRLMS